MGQRGYDRTRERLPWLGPLGVAAVIGAVSTTAFAAGPGDQVAVAAGLLFLGTGRGQSGLTTLAGSLIGGSLLGGAVGYAATALVSGVPLAVQAGVGLGIALGGGLGVVSALLAADAGETDGDATGAEAMTVDMETADAPAPRPADLFDDHPDPVLYVADRGHGPVVLAANDAFGATFDVPAAALDETPLEETLQVAADGDGSNGGRDVADAVAAGDDVDTALACQTADGPARFRLRTAGGDTDGYVVFTPADDA